MANVRDTWAAVISAVGVLSLSTSMAIGQGALQQLEEKLDATPPVPGANRAADGELPEPIPAIESRPEILQGNRPSLGITVIDVTRANQARYGLTVRRGALISNVRQGTAAAKYGLPIGGAIVAIDGRRIDSANDLVATIETYQPGDEVEITYFDGDRMGRKKIRLGRRAAAAVPSGPAARAHRSPNSPLPPQSPPLRLGQPNRAGPALKKLEGILDRLIPTNPPLPGNGPVGPNVVELPAPKAPAPKAPAPNGTTDELTLLRQQIVALQRQLELLQQRMDELDRRLPPPESAPDEPEPAAESKPADQPRDAANSP